jgi:hypothetical protein
MQAKLFISYIRWIIRGKMSNIDADYEWVNNQNLSKFRGKWIAVHNKRILSSGEYADDVAKEAKKKTKESVFLVKVPLEGYISV